MKKNIIQICCETEGHKKALLTHFIEVMKFEAKYGSVNSDLESYRSFAWLVVDIEGKEIIGANSRPVEKYQAVSFTDAFVYELKVKKTIELPLNGAYKALISADKIIVGCQEFSPKVIAELDAAIESAENIKYTKGHIQIHVPTKYHRDALCQYFKDQGFTNNTGCCCDFSTIEYPWLLVNVMEKLVCGGNCQEYSRNDTVSFDDILNGTFLKEYSNLKCFKVKLNDTGCEAEVYHNKIKILLNGNPVLNFPISEIDIVSQIRIAWEEVKE